MKNIPVTPVIEYRGHTLHPPRVLRSAYLCGFKTISELDSLVYMGISRILRIRVLSSLGVKALYVGIYTLSRRVFVRFRVWVNSLFFPINRYLRSTRKCLKYSFVDMSEYDLSTYDF